jgi:hypothetical protein
MWSKQIDLKFDIQKMGAEGYEVKLFSNHLYICSVPYLDQSGNVHTDGVLGTPVENPGDHVVYWSGSYPFAKSEEKLTSLQHQQQDIRLSSESDVVFHFSFSNKPQGGFQNYFDKMRSYINIICGPAMAVDSTVTPQTYMPLRTFYKDSPFEYDDTCSLRANTMAINAKAKGEVVAIIGLGGTGSYVLDFLAKSYEKEVHLFDADVFCPHNAFRFPGASSFDDVSKQEKKVAILARKYSSMKKNIVAHPYQINQTNMKELIELGVTSVFLCLDCGEVKKPLIPFLQEHEIFCVDTGMSATIEKDELQCSVRTTVIKKETLFADFISLSDDEVEDVYKSNIQIAEMNALNAILAVVQWKKHLGIYANVQPEETVVYSSDSDCLFWSERKNG